jgi:hypothetical protein
VASQAQSHLVRKVPAAPVRPGCAERKTSCVRQRTGQNRCAGAGNLLTGVQPGSRIRGVVVGCGRRKLIHRERLGWRPAVSFGGSLAHPMAGSAPSNHLSGGYTTSGMVRGRRLRPGRASEVRRRPQTSRAIPGSRDVRLNVRLMSVCLARGQQAYRGLQGACRGRAGHLQGPCRASAAFAVYSQEPIKKHAFVTRNLTP